MKPKAVVFDMDGVVVDSTRAWCITFNQALSHFGFPEVSEDKFVAEILGGSTEGDEQYFPCVSVDEILLAYNRFFPENLGEVEAFSDTVEVLKQLRCMGFKTAIATNTPRDLASKTLKKTGILDLFDEIVTADDVSEGKPDPEMIFLACERLGVSVEETFYVGDTASDVKAAEAAGCRMVGVGIDGGDDRISSLGELIPLIESI